MPIYDDIGRSYAKHRLADPRIVTSIIDLLEIEKGSTIADIGAGTGSYSYAIAQAGFFVYAVEPSAIMRSQAAPHPQLQWIAGYAEDIPLSDSSVVAVISILAIHHFSNLEKAIREMNRIANTGTLLFLTFDPRYSENFWLHDYFPFLREYDQRIFPPIDVSISMCN